MHTIAVQWYFYGIGIGIGNAYWYWYWYSIRMVLVWYSICMVFLLVCVIHQVAQAGFPEEPPKDEQALLIHTEFSYSAGPEKAHFSVFPLL
jgi:hypothetical protein